GAASRQDYLQLERLLSVYEDTFTYMLTLKEQFVSFGGPHQILLKKYHDTGSKFKKRMDKPGLPGVLEKYAMPAVGALITGGALVKTGVLTWLADRLVLVGIDPLLVEGTLGVGAMGLVAAGIKVAMGSLMGVASRKRHNVLELRAEEALMEIGFQLNEIKKAMVNLAGMEYLRLAAKNELPISPVQESSYIIAQKMACLAVEMREKYGFNLALPIEVENDMLGLLHPVHVSKPRLIAQCIHSHLEAIFRRQHDGHYTAMYSNGLHAA
ncbi:MAG: hypothetical protein NT051_03205, partial [Candidatus Micrarchaeota archaeon]|nr:hypothetical protein [Candidatus Micrarchaeota archaeon]